MDCKVLFDISHLRFERQAIADVNNGMFFLSNVDKKREDFYTEIYKKQYGLNDINYIPNSVFGYSEFSMPDADMQLDEQIQMMFEDEMFERMQFIEPLLSFMWFEKDNSIGLFSVIGEIPAKRMAARVSKSLSYWNCKGEKENISFSEDEIQSVSRMVMKFKELITSEKPDLRKALLYTDLDQNGKPYKQYLSRSTNFYDYNSTNCIERAFTFLNLARSQKFIIYKIAYYMAVFESLFTTNSTEIVTRMSYRVAFYLGESAKECCDIYETMADAYNVRSKFLHGQKFDSEQDIEQDRLIGISTKIDKILRRAFRKMFDNPEPFTKYDNRSRDKYLSTLVFGLPFDHAQTLKNIKLREQQREIEKAKAEEKQRKTDAQNKNK